MNRDLCCPVFVGGHFYGTIRRITCTPLAFWGWNESFMHHIWQVKIGQFRIPDYVPGEVQVLLRRILVVNPTRRYTVHIMAGLMFMFLDFSFLDFFSFSYPPSFLFPKFATVHDNAPSVIMGLPPYASLISWTTAISAMLSAATLGLLAVPPLSFPHLQIQQIKDNTWFQSNGLLDKLPEPPMYTDVCYADLVRLTLRPCKGIGVNCPKRFL
jgi:hypothetical protein